MIVAVKATLVLLIALGLLAFARRATASVRHRIAAAAFGVLLLLPVAGFLVPKKVVEVPADAPVVRAVAEAPVTNDAVAAAPAVRGINWQSIALRVYLAGVGFLGLSLLAGIVRLRRWRENAEVSVSGTRLANEMAEGEGMRRGIEVVISEELAVPMTFGFSRPTILLPAETADWDEAAMRRAIRHELEHIARRDWLTQIAARLGCALYWPHPFVWALWRRLRLEAERACDDAVIRTGVAAEPYAEQLVSLARTLVGRGRVPALAMATRSNLGQRVEAILDARLHRGRITRTASAVVAVVALAFLITVAPLQLVAQTMVLADEAWYESEEDAAPLDRRLMKYAALGDVEAIRGLLARGAKANTMIVGDGSPLMMAAAGGHVEAMEVLLDAGADPNRGVRGDGNALTSAARHGKLEAVRLLLDRGAEIDRGVEGDGNALIMAAAGGHVEVVEFLLDRGADIEKVVAGDENPLIHASENGQAEAVRLLIARGANVNARVWAEYGDGRHIRGEWRTPLSMARRNGHEDVVRILLAAGAKN